jgi:hypothetical protein
MVATSTCRLPNEDEYRGQPTREKVLKKLFFFLRAGNPYVGGVFVHQ